MTGVTAGCLSRMSTATTGELRRTHLDILSGSYHMIQLQGWSHWSPPMFPPIECSLAMFRRVCHGVPRNARFGLVLVMTGYTH